MKRILRILALVLLVGGLVFFEVKWISGADYENQKNRTAELLADIAGEISVIEVQLLEDGEIGESKTKFDTALSELRAIPYATTERGELLGELAEYEGNLSENAELAKELKVLRSLCMGFVEKVAVNYKEKTVNAELFRTMNKEFLEIAQNLPEAKYAPVQELVAELKAVANQVAVSSAATANCVGVCAKATTETQKTALEKKLNEALAKIEKINSVVRDEFDSGELVWRLHNI